ncbi:MAG: hypothetical protein VX747_14370 [Actinomycetota bacterium]|nr:hypothetical protein [Actinomycetota bacterium]
MTHLLRLDAVAHRDEFAVRLDGHLLGHVVRDPRALTEIWTWWADGGGVPQQHEDSREMAVYRLLVGYGLDFATARSLVHRGAVLVAA